MLVLPDNLREKLKEPLGNLMDEQELLKLLQNEKYIVSVGDLVTFTLLNNGIHPIICIIDYILERKESSLEMREKIQRFGKKHIKINLVRVFVNSVILFTKLRQLLMKVRISLLLHLVLFQFLDFLLKEYIPEI